MTERGAVVRRKWLATVTAMIGTFSMVLAATILNVALPRIMADYGVGQPAVQWLVTGFLAAMTTTMLLNAWCVARFGMRATFIGAIVLFCVASLAAAVAPNIGWLIGARVLQGAAAGIVQPLGMIVIFEVFAPDERGKGFGLYGLGVVLGPAVAPIIGGLLVDHVSWRAVFLIALPFCIAALPMARAHLRGPAEGQRKARLDVPGLVLLSATLAVTLWGLARGPRVGWHDDQVLAALAAGGAGAVLFVLREWFCAAPLLSVRAFRSPGFAGGFVAAMAIGAGLFGSTYLIPLFLMQAKAMEASAAGMLLLPGGLAMALTFPVAGQLTDKLAPALVAALGLALFVVSCLLMAATDAGLLALVTLVMIGRVGIGLMMTPVTATSLHLLAPPMVPQGSGAMNFGRQMGGALGVALVSVVLHEYDDGYHAAFYALAIVFALAALPIWLLHRSTTARKGRT